MTQWRDVLLDTGPIYALLDARDQYHTRAVELFKLIKTVNLVVNVAYPALLETHRLLLSRSGRDRDKAHRSITQFADLVILRYPNETDGLTALTSLERYNDQHISLTDATIAAMSRRLKLRVATFDQRHFSVMEADVFDDTIWMLDLGEGK